MNMKEQLTELLKSMRVIVKASLDAKRDLTDAEIADLEAKNDQVDELRAKIARAEKQSELVDSIAKLDPSYTEHADGSGGFVPGGFSGSGKGFMAGSKQTARQLAAKTGGAKGLVAATAIPLTAQSPIELGKVPTSILDVLAVTRQPSPVWRYPRQVTRTNNAAIVAPGAVKPQSDVSTIMVDGALQVFAHYSKPTDEYVLTDNDALSRFLASELTLMLREVVEEEVLNGDGTTGHLRGILNTSGVQVQAFAVDPLTTLRMAILKAENLGHTADVFVIHPLDWATIETTRNTSGAFDLGTAIDRAAQKVWGVQVVTSGQIAPGLAAAVDLSAVGLDTDTQGIQVKWGTAEGGFVKNEVIARVEGRFGVSVFQAAGVVKAQLTDD